MDLFLIDGLGPFFRGLGLRRINWSRIPFEHLPQEGRCAERFWAQVRSDLETFATRSVALGFDAISLDNLAHLTGHSCYELEVALRDLVSESLILSMKPGESDFFR